MRVVVIGFLSFLLALPAWGQMTKRQQCEMQAGDPSNPTYEATLKQCMGVRGRAAAGGSRGAAPRTAGQTKRQQCEMQAGDPSNPTYESTLKQCMGARGR